MTDQPLDLDAIEARLNAATPGPWHLTDADTIVAPLTSEVVADAWEPTQASRNGEFIENARTDVETLIAEVRRLRGRLWELERPSTEAERNALRQSFMELAAQASEDHDHEGAFDLDCQLREREEQWKREDAAAVSPAI
jgi:hypothetical protein